MAVPPPPKSSGAVTSSSSTFVWTLEGLSVASFTDAPPDSSWYSKEFVAADVRWRLFVDPNTNTENGAGVGVFLELSEEDCTVTLVKPARLIVPGEKWADLAMVFSTKEPKPEGAGDNWGRHLDVTHAELVADPAKRDQLFPGGKLTITAELHARSPSAPPEVPPSNLGEELGELLKSGEAADVTFRAGDQTFRAHSVVLLARCAALQPQLAGPLASKPPFQFTVPQEIQPLIFKRLLQFIYTDELLFKSYEEAQHLLHAASYYGLPRLQSMCEAKLQEGLTLRNALNTLELAHMNATLQLRDGALRFVAANAAAVMASEGWTSLQVSHPELVNAVLHTVVNGAPPKSITPVVPPKPVQADAAKEAPAPQRGTKRGAPM